jgi:GntR family transcriptional regulator/MocR family aminotransferase
MFNLTALAFTISKESKIPVFVQLCDQIREKIVAGQIHQNSRLPPTRSFAIELGLSRSTVVTVYDQLSAEGYIEGRRGSGFFVCQLGESDYQQSRVVKTRPDISLKTASIERLISHAGFPDNRLFPYRAWAQCLSRTARMTPEALVNSKSPLGDEALRTSIASYLSDWRGLNIQPQQILVTAGSIDALETCIRTIASAGDSIGLENPGYQPLRNIVENQGMSVDWLNATDQGTQLPQPGSPKMVILTPSHQYPLGGTMSPSRRLEYQQWANENNAWIIEDDYDSEFRYAGRPIPAMASMEGADRTIYIGTFSKVFSVSLRLGYLVMPPNLIPDFLETLARFGNKAALPCQRALSNFIDSGEFYRHIRRVRRIYAERRRILIDQLQLKLSDYVSFQDHQAGMQISVELAAGINDQEITRLAKTKGLAMSPLSSHYGGGNSKQGLVLGFCGYTESELNANVEILKQVIESSCNTGLQLNQ